MRIALLTDGIYPYVIGGMQKHSMYLAKYLAREGCQVDLYHMRTQSGEEDDLAVFTDDEKKNINAIAIGFPSLGKGFGHYIRESYDFSRKILAEYRKQPGPDFIYAKGFTGWEFVNKKRQGEKFPPIAVNFHGYEMFQKAPGFRSYLQQRLLLRSPARFIMLNADHVISYGGKITAVIRSVGVAEKKIICLPAGIDDSWLNTNEPAVHEKLNFVFAGRWERRKGVQELNTVVSELIRKQRSFTFQFIGPIPAHARIKDPSVIYHGEVKDPAEMKKKLSECDILVCPSHSEGMPNVILEAMACGLAVIASDTGAVSELIDAQNGWLFEPGNSVQLANCFEQAFETGQPALRNMKLRSEDKVRTSFLWTQLAKRTIEKINACIQQDTV